MIKIIKLDPVKDKETINEINQTIDELFGTYDNFMNDIFGNSFFSIPYKQETNTPLKKEWVSLGDLIDKFCQKSETKTPQSNQCCEKTDEVEDYSDVKNIDHIV